MNLIISELYFQLINVNVDLILPSLPSLISPSIIALVGLLGVILTLYQNHRLKLKEIRANVISKSRVEWLQDVRGLIGDYLTQSYFLKNKVNSVLAAGVNNSISIQEYYENYYLFLNKRDLLLMYISETKEHNAIVTAIEKLHTDTKIEIKDIGTLNKKIYHKKQRESAENLRNESRKYFKQIWEEAKGEAIGQGVPKNKEVQS